MDYTGRNIRRPNGTLIGSVEAGNKFRANAELTEADVAMLVGMGLMEGETTDGDESGSEVSND